MKDKVIRLLITAPNFTCNSKLGWRRSLQEHRPQNSHIGLFTSTCGITCGISLGYDALKISALVNGAEDMHDETSAILIWGPRKNLNCTLFPGYWRRNPFSFINNVAKLSLPIDSPSVSIQSQKHIQFNYNVNKGLEMISNAGTNVCSTSILGWF